MTKDMKTRIIVAVIGVAIVVVVGTQYRKTRTKSLHQTQGTILSIDVASRQATIEFVHPKSGQRFQLAGDVPADCNIHIDGKPATLADLKVGEQVRVEGTVGRDKHVVAKSVWVTRAPTTTSAPTATTRPSGAP